jgi:hypothetical protein
MLMGSASSSTITYDKKIEEVDEFEIDGFEDVEPEVKATKTSKKVKATTKATKKGTVKATTLQFDMNIYLSHLNSQMKK